MKKKNFIFVLIVGVSIIAIAILFAYSQDQGKIRGFNFGNNLQAIQDDLKKEQVEFYSNAKRFDEGEISLDEFLEISEQHFFEMENFKARYESLDVPKDFLPSVELFKLSTMAQLESDLELVTSITEKNEEAKIRSDLLLQQSLEYELAGLALFNEVKSQGNP